MKINIITEEWYPVYVIPMNEDGWLFGESGEYEMSGAELDEYERIMEEFNQLQNKLSRLISEPKEYF